MSALSYLPFILIALWILPRGVPGAISVYMLALRGGVSVGALITGASVSLLGVRTALCINGVPALVAHVVNARGWVRAGAAARVG